ncbi:MAG: hypothetical protein QQN63_14490, partial [Nitrosopumilus sp.]
LKNVVDFILVTIADISLLQGARGEEEQNEYFAKGTSKVRWPNSKHNSYPSMAVDIAPYPIDWDDRERFVYLAGIIKGIAATKDIAIRWGGDFNMNNDLHDQSFHDLPHFELI